MHVLRRVVEAQHLLDRVGDERRIVDEAARVASGCWASSSTALASSFVVVSWPATTNSTQKPSSSFSVSERPSTSRSRRSEISPARCAVAARAQVVGEVLHEAEHPLERLGRHLHAPVVADHQLVRVAAQLGPVRLRDPEDQRDHLHRERAAHLGDEVGLADRGDRVEVARHDAADLVLHVRDPPRR